MTSLSRRPAQPDAPSPYSYPYPSALWDEHAPASCDEVLAARLAGGLRCLQRLGDALERLLRRLGGRPPG